MAFQTALFRKAGVESDVWKDLVPLDTDWVTTGVGSASTVSGEITATGATADFWNTATADVLLHTIDLKALIGTIPKKVIVNWTQSTDTPKQFSRIACLFSHSTNVRSSTIHFSDYDLDGLGSDAIPGWRKSLAVWDGSTVLPKKDDTGSGIFHATAELGELDCSLIYDNERTTLGGSPEDCLPYPVVPSAPYQADTLTLAFAFSLWDAAAILTIKNINIKYVV